jgi:phage FluMu protein Com
MRLYIIIYTEIKVEAPAVLAPAVVPPQSEPAMDDPFQNFISVCKNIALLGNGVLPILCESPNCNTIFSYPAKAIQIKCPKCLTVHNIDTSNPPFNNQQTFLVYMEFHKKNVISLPPKQPPPYVPKKSVSQLDKLVQ